LKNSLIKEGLKPLKDKSYSELNDKQKLAVDSTEGPVLVLAGPGTGKTQLLSVRASQILRKNSDILPENIMILTYTNAAAKAMKERLASVIAESGYDVEVCTFHSFANSVIQESEEAASYVGDKVRMGDVERVRAIEYILDHPDIDVGAIRPFNAPYLYLNDILKNISDLKQDGITPDDLKKFLSTHKKLDAYLEEKHAARLNAFGVVYGMYEQLKQGADTRIFDERGRYDYDDMIIFATQAIKKEKVLRDKYREQYRYIMVDEFQDTNGAQLELLFSLLPETDANICCVGDDDQSIFRFQGASAGNFNVLKQRFPRLKQISLKTNYRSSEDLMRVSKDIIGLIPQNERCSDKELVGIKDYKDREIAFREFTTQNEELLYIVDKARELKDTYGSYNNIAVLVRKRDDILKVMDAFLQAGIPYATDGKEDSSGEKRVRQLLDVLELVCADPSDAGAKDLALYKVISSDYFALPQERILKFVHAVNKKRESGSDVTLLEEFFDAFRAHAAAGALKTLFADAETTTVHTMLLNYIKGSGLFKFILKEYADHDVLRIRELRAVTSFVNMIKSSDLANPGIRLGEFMLEMKTRKDHGMPIRGELVTMTQDGVRIYTAHSAKGLEFDAVLIPFCLQNKSWPARPKTPLIPLPATLFKTKERIKEKSALRELSYYDETRLFYVAVTRARSTLIFTASPTENAITSSYLSRIGIDKDAADETHEEDIMQSSLELTDARDPFIGTESVLKDMISNLSLNPTRINTYMACPRKFLYNDVLRIPGAKKKSLIFGNCVHKALEETYKELKATSKFPPFAFFVGEFRKELRRQGVDDAMRNECMKKCESDDIKGWFGIAAKKCVIPIDLEKKITISVGDNIIFKGKYDKVEWADEKKRSVRVVDYKTGKPDDHIKNIHEAHALESDECDAYLRQLVCYKLLYETDKSVSRSHESVSEGTLVFIEPVKADIRKYGYKKGDYAECTVNITHDMAASMTELIKKVWRDIKDLKFQKLPEKCDKCLRCDFCDICWEA
jgi:DNA helicase-2/ATP-dependent DNA helicase PcrA